MMVYLVFEPLIAVKALEQRESHEAYCL